MRAFVTGSRCYGTPRADSDIDLVVLVSAEDLAQLREMCENFPGVPEPDSQPLATEDVSLRFGKLNLLATTCEKRFSIWRLATSVLASKSPASRDAAISVLDQLRAM